MCIIIVKPKGKALPENKIIETCFENNPHGAGIMYAYDGRVKIAKGLMTVDALKEAISDIPDSKNTPVVLHFRLATHGEKSPGNTHPFPLTGDFKDLQLLQNITDKALCHNGIMSQYGAKNATMSDTAFFAKMLSGLKTERSIRRALEAHKPGQRFVVMTGENIIRMGDFVKFKGCFYSNYGFKERVYCCSPEPQKPISFFQGIRNQYTFTNEDREYWENYAKKNQSIDLHDFEEKKQNHKYFLDGIEVSKAEFLRDEIYPWRKAKYTTP